MSETSKNNFLKKFILGPLKFVLILIVVAEETLIRLAGRAMGHLAHIPTIQRFESWAARRKPWQAALLFLVPTAIVQPLKIVPIILIWYGHTMLASILFVSIELLGATLLGRIFLVCQPALMTLPWFAKLHGWILRSRLYIHDLVHRSAIWGAAQALKTSIGKRLPFLKSMRPETQE